MSTGALAGPPISGAIYNAYGNFKPVGIYAGRDFDSSSDCFILITNRQHGRRICVVDGRDPICSYTQALWWKGVRNTASLSCAHCQRPSARQCASPFVVAIMVIPMKNISRAEIIGGFTRDKNGAKTPSFKHNHPKSRK